MDSQRELTIRAALATTVHRDPVLLSRALDSWLDRRWPGARTTAIAAPGSSGASSELFYVDVSGTPFAPAGAAQMVLRLAPAHAIYPIVDLGMQADCMRAAARHSQAPVPQVHGVETDPAYLGTAFLLMQKLQGRGAPDWPSYVLEGWIHDLPPEQQRTLWFNAVDAIAALHRTDITANELQQARLPVPGASALDRMLEYWALFLAMVREGGDYPVLEAAVEWLVGNRPELDADEGLVWGDASLRNMLFRDLQPAALMDFEFAHIGLRVFDVAFFALMDHIMAAGFAAGAPRLPGFAGVAETLDYYESISGRSVPARDYLLRMALTYSALATTRVYQRLAAQGRIATSEVAAHPPLKLLGEAFASGNLPD